MSQSAIPTQIGKLLLLLSSNQDGEVVATARAICRTLNTAGLDLHDLAKMIASPPVAQPPRLKRRGRSPSWQAPYGSANPDADMVAWCRQRGDDWLPPKDRDFLASVEPKLRRWGGLSSDIRN